MLDIVVVILKLSSNVAEREIYLISSPDIY